MPDKKKYNIVNPPGEHRMEGELRVCDPEKTDHTKDMESWRILKIMAELVDGFKMLRKYKLAATFFGSARRQLGEGIYADATNLAERLSESGFTIITGGASGIMEAANKGAYEAGGNSLGLNIKLATEQNVNGYLTDTATFNYFFTRKVMLAFASEVYIYFPGGFGTMDEFFEILTLVQTHKIKRIPIILYSKEYWTPLIDFFENHMLKKYNSISEGDLKLFTVVDSVDEAYEEVMKQVKC
jgi:uncharacterized protein (TIGR00730 family)